MSADRLYRFVNSKNTKEKSMALHKTQYISRIAVKLLTVLAVVIAAFLLYQSVTVSFYSSKRYTEPIFQMQDSTLSHILMFIAVCILTFCLNAVLKRFKAYQEKAARAVLVFAAVWLAAIGCIFLWQHPYYPSGDQLYIITAAKDAVGGSYPMMVNGGLIGMCPQNKGMIFLYEILYRIAGESFYRVGAFIHIIYVIAILFMGYYLLKNNTGAVICRIMYCFLMMLCAPLVLYLPYIYGDLGSICFIMVLFYSLSEFEKKLEYRYIVAAAVSAAVALLMRTNTWIVLIAVCIGMVLVALEKRNIRPLIAAVCIVVSAQAAVSGVNYMYEVRSGYEAKGIPTILYIAMGLQETDGQPGVYNHYHQSVYADNNFDTAAASAEGLENIKESVDKFINSPDYARYFFAKKLRMQWTEPTFEAFYATNSIPDGVVAPLWINELYYGKPHDIVWKTANYYQSIVYGAFFVMVVALMLKRLKDIDSITFIIPLIAVVGGFLFSIIWESQSRYVLPYYVMIVMYAPVGLNQISEWIAAAAGLITKKRKKAENKEDRAA